MEQAGEAGAKQRRTLLEQIEKEASSQPNDPNSGIDFIARYSKKALE